MKLRIFGYEVRIEDELILFPSNKEVRRQIREYVSGRRFEFDISVDWNSIPDEMAQFLKALRKVGYGSTITYGQVADMLGIHPRKVGRLCAKNPLPLIFPCHRVVGKNGIGGYSYGIGLKKKLLEFERKNVRKQKINK